MIEVYANNKIQYMAPLSKQDDFYVPEAKESSDDAPSSSSSGDTVEASTSSTEDKPSEPSVTIVTPEATDKIQKVGTVVVESVEGNQDEESGVRRRRNLPQPELVETTMTLPHLDTVPKHSSAAAGGETVGEMAGKRKDSSQSSASSSFEEIGVEDLK